MAYSGYYELVHHGEIADMIDDLPNIVGLPNDHYFRLRLQL